MSTLKILQGVREYLNDPAHWTQGVAYRDEKGLAIDEPLDAAQCCLVGASRRVRLLQEGGSSWMTSQSEREADRQLARAVLELYPDVYSRSTTHVSAFNDDPVTEHRDVLAVIDKAIELEKEDEYE